MLFWTFAQVSLLHNLVICFSHVVTHLICSAPVGKKYLYALSTQRSEESLSPAISSLGRPIYIVNELWIMDCIRYQRKVDESDYQPQWMNSGNSDSVPQSAEIEDEQARNLSQTPRANLASNVQAEAISALLSRAHHDSLDFQYGDTNHDEDDENTIQQESEVIDEEKIEKDLWNEKKMDCVSTGESITSPVKYPITLGPPVFLLGGGSHSKYRSLEQHAKDIIHRLGGAILSSNSPYSSCTHLILWELKRTEKYLCCCVSGKVLSHFCLSECHHSGSYTLIISTNLLNMDPSCLKKTSNGVKNGLILRLLLKKQFGQDRAVVEEF